MALSEKRFRLWRRQVSCRQWLSLIFSCAVKYVVFLSVTHLMSDDHGDFVYILRQIENPFIHRHYMTKTAGRIKCLISIQKYK